MIRKLASATLISGAAISGMMLLNKEKHLKVAMADQNSPPSRDENQLRENYISKVQLFMGSAILTAKRSKNNSVQVGASIVNNKNNRIISLGYNGTSDGGGTISANDKIYLWKQADLCHAELNAITNAKTTDLTDCIMYVTQHPCCKCAKAIIDHGIREVYYLTDTGKDEFKDAKVLFEKAGVKCHKLSPTPNSVMINFAEFEK